MPEAQDPEIHVRILTIRGMLEINYDVSEAPGELEGSRFPGAAITPLSTGDSAGR
jgi:hypothetical protein